MSEPTIDDAELPEKLYHYTTAAGLHGILESHTLWATHAAHLNDSQEMLTGVQVVLQGLAVQRAWATLMKGFTRDTMLKKMATGMAIDWLAEHIQNRAQFLRQNFGPFVTCLSREGDQLSQWRGYGRGGGYAIRFDPQELRTSLQENSKDAVARPSGGKMAQQLPFPLGVRRFVEIEYPEREPDSGSPLYLAIQACIDGAIEHLALGELTPDDEKHYGTPERYMAEKFGDAEVLEPLVSSVMEFVTRQKHPGFKEEKEYRIVTFATPDRYDPGDIGLVPRVEIEFAPSCIKEIVIGPGPNKETRESSVRYYLDTKMVEGEPKYPGVEVNPSGTPFTGT